MPRSKKSFKREISYVCGGCGREVGQANLVAEVVQFRALGNNRRVLLTRTRGWLCNIANGSEPSCLDKHPAYNAKAFVDAPGWADTKSIKK